MLSRTTVLRSGEGLNTRGPLRGGARPVTPRPTETPLVIVKDWFWVHAFKMEKFIEGVRMQPSLWNPLDPDYREIHIKDEAWRTVVEHYNHLSIPNSKWLNVFIFTETSTT